ncbi:MAG TPA: hypothetical protein VHC70_03445 [Phycisphaerales bacterium]|nr:hypothetical protein [Phycisphaerales bacterium]
MKRAFQIIIAGAALVLSSGARAQQPDAGGEDFTGETPRMPQMPSRAMQQGRGANEITLEVKSFGITGLARPGEWTGVRIAVNDSSEKVRNVMVRLSVLDPDGDTALMQRVIVTNPGAVQTLWLYLRLPFGASQGFDTDITASEAIESGTGTGDAQQYVSGRLLGRQPFTVSPTSLIPAWVGMLPVVGYGAGLEQYKWEADSRLDFAVTGHELTFVMPQLPMSGLPDRWQGYSGITALAWTSAASDDNPLNMRKDQADAIREWVIRGGHLIVVLPNVGQNWVGQPGNPLADILPAAKVTRTEGVDLNKYRALLTSDREVSLSQDPAIVQSFTPAIGDVWPSDTFPIMVGPEGDVVVLRRSVGCGMVTVVGLDVASQKLQRITHGFMADQFWNRILGKRLRTLTLAEISAGDKFKPFPGQAEDAVQSYAYSVHAKEIDAGIAKAVNDEGKAAMGLMMAFFVFVAYWLIAGPIGYFLLKQRNWKQHAWVGFVAATAVFTLVAWGGANLLKPQRVHGKHLTILDGVYGQTTQRARSWIGMYLPSYGEQEISVAPAPGSPPPGGGVGSEWHNLIATLDTPAANGASGWSSFPDARGYIVEARKPDSSDFPSRATTRQVQVDWAGSLPEGWGMPHPVADASVPVGQEIKLVDRKDKDGNRTGWGIEGKFVHGLPSSLLNVWFTIVREPLASESPSIPPGERIRMTYSMGRIQEWKPNDPIDLGVLFEKPGRESGKLDEDCLIRSNSYMASQFDSEFNPSEFGFNTAFFDMLRPPDWMRGQNSGSGTRYVYRRETTHGFDLSRWFTQPCVIIVGELGGEGSDAAECPVPIRVSGNDVRKRLTGRTIVRWVYPLEASPFRAAPKPKQEGESAAGSAAGDAPSPSDKKDDGMGAGSP